MLFKFCFRYYEIDPEDSISYSLRYKSILEYPEILVVRSIHKEAFSDLFHVESQPFKKPIKNC